MFERGRLIGQLEMETKWQFKDAGRRTRQAVKDAAARLQRERDHDWSNLDSEELIQRLVERNVITIEGGKLLDKTNLDAFTDLCRRFLNEYQTGSLDDSMDDPDEPEVQSNSNELP
jgi:hypothetical protein